MSTDTKPRIPAGTRVKWRARYSTDPVNEGVVMAFVARGARFPSCAGDRHLCMNTMAPVYVVQVEGRHASRSVMFPYASRLEAQNPEAMNG